MGIIEVEEILKKEPNRWFDSREICSLVKVSASSATTSLKRMRKYGIVHYRLMKGKPPKYLYRHKKVQNEA